MKKETKKQLIGFAIILVMSLSSLAYVITFFTGEQQEKPKVLTGFVSDGILDQTTEYDYIQKDYTIMRFYYSDEYFIPYVTSLPEILRTNNNQVQLIVEKIQSNETRAEIYNIYNYKNLTNVDDNSIFVGLCETVLSPPIDCILLNQTTI